VTLRGLPSAAIGYGAPTAATSCRRPTNYQAGRVPVSNHSDGFPPQTDESLSQSRLPCSRPRGACCQSLSYRKAVLKCEPAPDQFQTLFFCFRGDLGRPSSVVWLAVVPCQVLAVVDCQILFPA